jgi:hypothetical protein
MRKYILMLMAMFLVIGMAGAANYMYEKSSIKGVGMLEQVKVVSTQPGFAGQKLVERVAGSGQVVVLEAELEAERQMDSSGNAFNCTFPNNCAMDYINYTKEAEFEYMPVSYQTGSYDAKWVDKLCVQNYKIGGVLTEMYAHSEHLVRSTEVKTRGYGDCAVNCCTGVLEANVNSNVIGVAHVGWMSRDPVGSDALKGRHAEYGRSVDDLTGVFSINKFIQLWGNSTCQSISVDWLPCLMGLHLLG